MAETQQPAITIDTGNSPTFGMRLKSIREARGLKPQEVAAQLRLSKEIICMLENQIYPDTLPITFIRGYVRSYGKFLDIPEHEIKLALEPIKPKEIIPPLENVAKNSTVNHLKYFMQFMTAIIAITIIGLMGMWWHAHNDSDVQSTIVAENFYDNKEINTHSSDDVANLVNQEANEKSILNSNDSAALAKTMKETPIQNTYSAVKKSRLFSLIVGNHHYIMQFAIRFIIFIMIGLISLCWYNYKILSKSHFSLKETAAIDSDTFDNPIAIQSIKKIRIYLALVLFMLISLFCIWWYNLLVSLSPNLSKQNINTVIKSVSNNDNNNIIIPFKPPGEKTNPLMVDNQSTTHNAVETQKMSEPEIIPSFTQSVVVKPTIDAKLHINSMKKIAPTLAKKYTPISIADESDASEESDPVIADTNRQDTLAMQTESDD